MPTSFLVLSETIPLSFPQTSSMKGKSRSQWKKRRWAPKGDATTLMSLKLSVTGIFGHRGAELTDSRPTGISAYKGDTKVNRLPMENVHIQWIRSILSFIWESRVRTPDECKLNNDSWPTAGGKICCSYQLVTNTKVVGHEIKTATTVMVIICCFDIWRGSHSSWSFVQVIFLGIADIVLKIVIQALPLAM